MELEPLWYGSSKSATAVAMLLLAHSASVAPMLNHSPPRLKRMDTMRSVKMEGLNRGFSDELATVYYTPRTRFEKIRAVAATVPFLLWRLRRVGGMRRICLTALFAFLLHSVIANLQLEMKHRPQLLKPEALAQQESQFGSFSFDSARKEHLMLHWLRYSHKQSLQLERKSLVHCNHGFGASALSWVPSIRSGLGDALGALDVVAHDAPAFGLTERLRKSNESSFSNAANARLTSELVRSIAGQPNDFNSSDVHFVGHSMGALTALRAAVEWCSARNSSFASPTMLVLVAPAIFAPSSSSKDSRMFRLAPPPQIKAISHIARCVQRWITRRVLAPAISPFLRFALRKLVLTSGFWENGLAVAWGDDTRKTKGYSDAVKDYSLPARVINWEDGMLRFVIARMCEGVREFFARRENISELLARASALTNQGRLRVLIVHGGRDRIVPMSNSLALRALLGPKATLVGGRVAKQNSGNASSSVDFEECGHVPHEEAPDRFVQVLREWAGADRVIS